MKDFECYSLGLISASACTSLDDAEATERMNLENPTGIQSSWSIASDEKFHSGETHPCPCEKRPDTHRHILFEC